MSREGLNKCLLHFSDAQGESALSALLTVSVTYRHRKWWHIPVPREPLINQRFPSFVRVRVETGGESCEEDELSEGQRYYRSAGDAFVSSALRRLRPMLPVIREAAFWMESRARCAYLAVVCACV